MQPHRATSTTEGAIIKKTPVKLFPRLRALQITSIMTIRLRKNYYIAIYSMWELTGKTLLHIFNGLPILGVNLVLFGAMRLARNCNFIEEAPFADCCVIVWGFYKVKNYKLKYCFFQIMCISVAESQRCQDSISFVRVNRGRVPLHPFLPNILRTS